MPVLSVPPSPRAGTSHPAAEQRAEPRFSCPRLVRMRPVRVPETNFRLSLVHNVSANGIGLMLTVPCEPGSLLEIEMHGRQVIRRFARVVHSTKHESGWLVGCTLNQSLTDNDLERLLN